MDEFTDLLRRLREAENRQRRTLNSTLAQIASIEKAIKNQEQLDMLNEQKAKK